jgi:hypothetical protein
MTTQEVKLKNALRDGFHTRYGRGPGIMTGAIGVALGQARGLPDRYFGIPGYFVWIEAKVGAGNRGLKESSQIRQCRDLALCGQRVFVLWCEDISIPAKFRTVELYQVGCSDLGFSCHWDTMKTEAFWNKVFGSFQ